MTTGTTTAHFHYQLHGSEISVELVGKLHEKDHGSKSRHKSESIQYYLHNQFFPTIAV